MVKQHDASLDVTFAALADPTRRAILARLSQGAAPMREVAEPFRISWPAITKHVQVLERARLVRRGRSEVRQRGTTGRLRVDADC